MKYKTYLDGLIPKVDHSSDDHLNNDILDQIKERCSDILKIYKKSKRYIYRGLNFTTENFIKPATKDRKTIGTSPEIQKIYDDYLEAKFGWRPKSRGFFCVGKLTIADGWNDYVYIVFPINGTKFIWSSLVNDFYGYIMSGINSKLTSDILQLENNWNLFAKSTITGSARESLIKNIEYMLKPILATYRDDDILKAIRSNHEIVFNNDRGYYIIMIDYFKKYRDLLLNDRGSSDEI